MTGTPGAYRPSGSTLAIGKRPRATGDYRPWNPGALIFAVLPGSMRGLPRLSSVVTRQDVDGRDLPRFTPVCNGPCPPDAGLLRALQPELAHQLAPLLALAREIGLDLGERRRIDRHQPDIGDRFFISGSAMIFFISACSLATIAFGVCACANSMCHDTASKSGAGAASAKVGTSGSCGRRCDDDTASARSLPS